MHFECRFVFGGFHARIYLYRKSSYIQYTLNVKYLIMHPFWRWLNIPGELSQYHGCWCPGSLRRQVISSHDIDLNGDHTYTSVEPRYALGITWYRGAMFKNYFVQMMTRDYSRMYTLSIGATVRVRWDWLHTHPRQIYTAANPQIDVNVRVR